MENVFLMFSSGQFFSWHKLDHFTWFSSACFGWLASLAFPDQALSGNWDLLHVIHFFPSQSLPDQPTNQTASSKISKNQPNNNKKANPSLCKPPRKDYLPWTDWQGLTRGYAWKHSCSSTDDCKKCWASRLSAWVALTPLSHGLQGLGQPTLTGTATSSRACPRWQVKAVSTQRQSSSSARVLRSSRGLTGVEWELAWVCSGGSRVCAVGARAYG